MRFRFEDLAPVALDFNEGDVAPLNQTIKIFDHYMGNADFEIDSLENATSASRLKFNFRFKQSIDGSKNLN